MLDKQIAVEKSTQKIFSNKNLSDTYWIISFVLSNVLLISSTTTLSVATMLIAGAPLTYIR